jgi:hypothetical protein
LSLTAGLSPATTSFPGTVYLRGDNGTKVLNGLYIDHLYNAAGYTLAISATGGCNVTIDDCAYIGMTTNPVLDGGSVNGQIRNFSTISALNILTSNISTGTTSVDQIYTRNININPPSTVYISHPDLTINANLTTDEAEDPQPNNLNLFASSNINIQSLSAGGGGGSINIQCANNPALYSVNITGDTYVSRTLTANLGMSTTNINLSTINGAAYVPGGGGGGGWVSTATTALNMNGNGIGDNTGFLTISSATVAVAATDILVAGAGNSTIYTSQAFTSTAIDLVQVGGAGYIQRAAAGNIVDIAVGNIQTQAASTINTVPHTVFTGDITAAGVILTSTLNMNGFNITAGSNQLLSIGTAVPNPYPNTIAFSNYGGTLGDIKMKSYNIEIGDNQNGTISLLSGSAGYITTTAQSTINTVAETVFTGGVSRTLVSSNIPQPIIQYGQVSSSGGSGAVTVTIPTRYTSVSSYLPFACMADAPAAEIYVSTLTRATFEIGWQNGGGGAQLFNWHTMGT